MNFFHYTNQDGLPSSYVKSVIQDKNGFIWLVTRISVTRFDGSNFRNFFAINSSGQEQNIYGNKVFLSPDSQLIVLDKQGIYYSYNPNQEYFYPKQQLNNIGNIQALCTANQGYWICKNNKLFYLPLKSNKIIPLENKLTYVHLSPDENFSSIIFNNHQLIALDNKQRVIYIDTKRHQQRSFNLTKIDSTFSGQLQLLDSYGNIWISDFNKGLICLNIDSSSYNYLSKFKKAPLHIPHNLIHCLIEDLDHKVWIGTESGLAIYDLKTKNIRICQFKLNNPDGLNTDPIYSSFCDRQGNIWLGTYFGGINLWCRQHSFFTSWETGTNNWQLRGNVVSCLTEDEDSNLWIGLEDNGLEKINRKTGQVTHINSGPKSDQLSYNNIHALLSVSPNQLWIGTYTGGINILNTKTHKIKKLNRSNTDGIISNMVYDFLSYNDSIFIATSEGIVIYSKRQDRFFRLKPKTLQFTQFESIARTKNILWLSSANIVYKYNIKNDSLTIFDKIPKFTAINFVKTDSKGNLWIGDCYNGLCQYNPTNHQLKHFCIEEGFPASWIFSLEESRNGWYWASSDHGLIKFNPNNEQNIVYDSNSGIPFNQFNFRASYTDSQGTIYFGGNNGMVSFNEKTNPLHIKELPLAFTGIKLFNKQITPDKNQFIKQSINIHPKIILKHDQNVLTIQYSSINYNSKGHCQYAYYLEGFEHQWNYVGNRNFATYTNLNPGKYIFHVKSASNQIQKAQKERTLQIIILPPFWQTKWAYFIYLFILVGIFTIIFKVGKNLEKSRSLVTLERKEKEHADEIHQVKLDFFTNISHELKTPLTLILAPISRIMKEEQISPALSRQLAGIERNANRLYLLIQQLLEFRKIETGKEAIKVCPCSLNNILDNIGQSFENIQKTNHINFTTNRISGDDIIWTDNEKIDKILFNLLSNAFKYTPEGGEISLFCERSEQKNKITGLADQWLTIEVKDSGKGIKKELQEKIFDRFFQIEQSSTAPEGSGLGLAYVKSIVNLLKGEIKVDSIENKGSVFKVKLPVSKCSFSNTEISTTATQYFQTPIPIATAEQTKVNHDPIQENGLTNKPAIMIVEDNHELLNFMADFLQTKYNVITAQNGLEALSVLQKQFPELIISDIMMPKMDGIELTLKLKHNLETSHIPLLLLTSKTGLNNKLNGLKNGADYYIEKPFYPSILEQTIENIFRTRQNLINRFKKEETIPITEITHSESDKQFIEKLTGIIHTNIGNTELDVSLLLSQIGVSRSLLHLKLKNLVGCSATEFIRMIRLKEAVKLISSGKCNISEAAYETGFSSPTYFSRRFKEFYGQSPRDYFKK